jgi:TraM recognition site of TraD and TraG
VRAVRVVLAAPCDPRVGDLGVQADDYPMLSKKLAAAIVLDLIAIAQRHQNQPVPTFVAIDEFGAIDSDLVFATAGAGARRGFSVCLAAQTLADFSAASPDGSMATRVIGNLNALIIGRLNDAAEAEWIAQIAGTKDSWTTTQRTNLILPVRAHRPHQALRPPRRGAVGGGARH